MPSYSFRKTQPLSLRFWHWLNTAVILGLLGTVLLRKTFLSWRGNSALIQEKLQAAGTTVTPELAKEIAVAIRTPMWDWHIYLGFALGALLVGRVLIALFVEKQSPFGQAVKSALGVKALAPALKAEGLHYALVRAAYAVFYLATTGMVISGLMMTFKEQNGLSPELLGKVKEVHELMLWFFVLFTGGHVVGVIVAENRKDPGLISDMVNGGKR